MHSFQLTRSIMDTRNVDTKASPGYDADDDTAAGENSVSSADEYEYEENTLNRKCRPNPLTMRVPCRRRKRRRQEKHSQLPRLSIVHPDIDSSLTTHIVATRRQQLLQHRKPTVISEPPLSLRDLSNLLEDYVEQQHAGANYEAPTPVSDEDYLSAEQINVSEFNSSRGNCCSQARIRSSECMFLEDALEFTSDARILVEASSLHRVVHSNAAFCSLTAKDKPPQDKPSQKKASAIERIQERLRIGMPSNSFESVVFAMFVDRPVTVYPVQDSDGSGVIRYYLVEHAGSMVAALATKQLATNNIAEPAQTVG